MAMVRLLLLVVSLTWGIPRDCAGQRYAILAPRTVRPHAIYDLVVTNFATKEKQFLCEIVSSNDVVVGASSTIVPPNELRKVQIRLEDLEEGSYRLKVWKDQKQALINATELDYIDTSYLVLFQTDKPAYKPGDRVQFRVIFLYPNAYPVTKASMPSIFITDPDKYRMKQWINAPLTSGVFEGSFQLAEYTTHGLWTISASLNQQHYKEYFRVEEYILPLFKIQLQSVPNPYFHCNDSKMSLKLSASFVNGGSVRGNATVVVRANYNNYPTQTKEVARQELPINGMANVDFPINVVADNCDEERNVWFDVKVTESSTGVSYNLTSTITVQHNGGVTMEVLDGNDAFYPGLAMKLKVLLTTIDEKPLAYRNVTITYKVRDDNEISMDTVNATTLTLQTNVNGIVKFPINTTLKTVEVNAEGSYNDHTFPLVFAFPMYEDRNLEYLVIHTRQAYYSIHRNVTIELYSNVKFKSFYYIGYCSGRVCASGVGQSSYPFNDHRFVLIAKPLMKPQMKLLVFTVKEDGKILSSSIVIRILPTSKPALGITTTSMGPNSDSIVFNIMAENDAFVGMLGVDERVMQRSTANNDISQHKLEMALQALEDGSGVMWSSYDSFGSVGVTLLTDGYLPDVGFIPHFFTELERTGKRATDEYSPREDFPETWIWESRKPTSGNFSIEKSIPDTITTWEVSGFSVGPANGLQILKKRLQIKSRKRVFAELYMPSSMKRLEEVTVHCLVHNYGSATNVSLEMRPGLQATKMFLAEGATETVRVKLQSNRVGALTVEVIVSRPNGAIIDALKQTVPVRPEGLMKTVEDVRILDFPTQSKLKFNLSIPAVEEDRDISHGEVTLSVIGTFLNLNAFDLEQMATSSHGNGEENLLFLQTAMAVYDYLQQTNHVQPRTRDKFLSYMEVAYQQLLRYRLEDGSFSMFGSLYDCGGVWFTASTVESLQKLSKHMLVEKSLLTDALHWLVMQSNEDGSFNESCTIAHPHIQRTGGKELSLASSVLFAFVGNERVAQYEELVNKTLSLLLSANMQDVYLMAKTTYLLTLMDHPVSSRMLATLNQRAVVDGKYRYWRGPPNPESSGNLRDQETTAYALLANIKQNTISQLETIRIAQWLQRHSFAGDDYVSSLERIIALEALGAAAARKPSIVPHMYIEAGKLKFEVTVTNQQLLQSVILPSNTRSLTLSASGSGLVLIKLSYRYSLSNHSSVSNRTSSKLPIARKLFNVDIRKKIVEHNKLTLHLLFEMVQPLNASDSDLWKATIDLPTGYKTSKQHESYDNTTMSAIVQEHKSHPELVWDGRHVPKLFCTIIAYSRLPFVEIAEGLIYLKSFDTKDVVAVYPY